MKRLGIGIISFLLAIFLSVFGFFYLKNLTLQMEKQGQKIVEISNSENNTHLDDALKQFLTLYHKKRGYFGIYFNQCNIKELDALFLNLETEIKESDFAKTEETTKEILKEFHMLQESEIPRFSNIF